MKKYVLLLIVCVLWILFGAIYTLSNMNLGLCDDLNAFWFCIIAAIMNFILSVVEYHISFGIYDMHL